MSATNFTGVRRAIEHDVPWLLRELEQFDAFYGSSRSLVPDPDAAHAIVSGLVAAHPFFIADTAHGPIGFIAGALGPHPYNPALIVLQELFWWVVPQYRGSRAGLALLNAFVAFGKAHADWTVMTLESDSPVNPDTLTRRGFHLKETSYLLESA